MKKFLSALPDRLFRRKPLVVLVSLGLVFWFASFAWRPAENSRFLMTATSAEAAITVTPTSNLPIEYLTNAEQTTGIVFMAILLVMIVIIGTLYGIRKKPSLEK